MVVQSMIEMGVDVVYPVELPSQASLTIDGKNCFEPVVCKFMLVIHAKPADLICRLRVQRMSDGIHSRLQDNQNALAGRDHQLQPRAS
jgi:hypothetical protein